MLNRFDGYRQIERNDNNSRCTFRKSCDVVKNLCKSGEYNRQYQQNMNKLDERLSDVKKRLQAFTRDPKSGGFWKWSPQQIQTAYGCVVKYTGNWREYADNALNRDSKDKCASEYENAIRRLEELYNQLGDHVYKDKFVVNKSIITIYRTNKDGELEMQSEARMNTSMTRVEDRVVDGREMMFVNVEGGFRGLVYKNDVAKPVMRRYDEGEDIGDISLSKVVVITTDKLGTPLYQDSTGDTVLDELHLGDTLSLIEDDHSGDRIPVAFPGNKKGWVERGDIEVRSKENPFPRKSMDEAVKYAQAFLEKKVGFTWGGVSSDGGVDASGFIQNVCHMAGLKDMPRNSRDQYNYCQEHSKEPDNSEEPKKPKLFRELSEDEETKAGDLIFFLRELKKEDGSFYHSPYHVTIAKDKYNIIHAVGAPDTLPRLGVIESCLPNCNEKHDRHDPYPSKLAKSFVRMRVIPQETQNENIGQ